MGVQSHSVQVNSKYEKGGTNGLLVCDHKYGSSQLQYAYLLEMSGESQNPT